jgi:hypothetical protein
MIVLQQAKPVWDICLKISKKLIPKGSDNTQITDYFEKKEEA